MLIGLIVVIISQGIQILDHYFVHLKLYIMLHVICTSILKKKGKLIDKGNTSYNNLNRFREST